MNAWKYVGQGGKVLILATKDDFTGVPPDIVAVTKGAVAQPWGDRPGNPLPEKLIGEDRSTIEAALGNQGWFSN